MNPKHIALQSDKPDAAQLLAPNAKRAMDKLVNRRLQILRGLWDGKTQKEIAADLGIGQTRAAVGWHIEEMMKLLKANSATALCRKALAAGLLEVAEQKQGH